MCCIYVTNVLRGCFLGICKYLGVIIGIASTCYMIWLDFKDRNQTEFDGSHLEMHARLSAAFNVIWLLSIFLNRYSHTELSVDQVKCLGKFFDQVKPKKLRKCIIDVAPWISAVIVRDVDTPAAFWHKHIPTCVSWIMYKLKICL
jgi:hypothetical protein